jgi:hypothetical protein
MLAGSNMFVEQAGNGLGVSYLTALAGGAGTGSGGAGTGSGGAGTGTGGAGTGSGGGGTPEPVTPPNTITISGSINRYTEAVTITGTLGSRIDESQLELYIANSLVSTIPVYGLGVYFNYNTQLVNLGTQVFVRQRLNGNVVGISNTIQLQYAPVGLIFYDDGPDLPEPLIFDERVYNLGNTVKQEQLLSWGFATYRTPYRMRLIVSGITIVDTGCFGGGFPQQDEISGQFLLSGLTPYSIKVNGCGITGGYFTVAISSFPYY